MATDDYTLGEEVRVMTRIPESVVAADELRSLISRAKNEIQAEAETAVADWYASDNAERALFWLTAIFVVGEVGSGDEVSIGPLEFAPAEAGDGLASWRQRYEKAVAALAGSSTRPQGIVSVERDNRVYGE